jgi:hypothetical protein
VLTLELSADQIERLSAASVDQGQPR